MASVAAFALLATSTALAQKGKKPGGDPPTVSRYAIVELPFKLPALDVTNPDTAGYVTVIGESDEFGYVSAAVARVRVSDKAVHRQNAP